MIQKVKWLTLASIGILLYECCAESRFSGKEDEIERFFRKKEVIIAVMDSGLGGLSIMADAMERMRAAKIFVSVHFLFFNALFSSEGGYNSLPSREKKILVFNSALKSLESLYRPDLILIGCNTLSALYQDTPFSRQTRIPVKGIIETGAALLAEKLKASPDAKIILFGTQTTVEEGIYEKELVKRGFLSERIVSHACPELVPYIEKGSDSDETEMLIYAYADEALQRMGRLPSGFYVSLNCTHYAYSLNLWKAAFRNLDKEPLDFLNPNARMNDFLFRTDRRSQKDSLLSAAVVSMVPIDEQRILSTSKKLEALSPQTAAALVNYSHRENLFEWKRFVTQDRQRIP